MATPKKTFGELYTLPISDKVKSNYKGLKYLSWADAYKIAIELDPDFSHTILPEEVVEYNNIEVSEKSVDENKERGTLKEVTKIVSDRYLICNTECTFLGITKKMFLPVMNSANKAVANPDGRDICDNRMRCLVKNIALFGIGLYLYVGEDIPSENNLSEKINIIETHKEKVATFVKLDDLKSYHKNLPQSDKDNPVIKALFKQKAEEIKLSIEQNAVHN